MNSPMTLCLAYHYKDGQLSKVLCLNNWMCSYAWHVYCMCTALIVYMYTLYGICSGSSISPCTICGPLLWARPIRLYNNWWTSALFPYEPNLFCMVYWARWKWWVRRRMTSQVFLRMCVNLHPCFHTSLIRAPDEFTSWLCIDTKQHRKEKTWHYIVALNTGVVRKDMSKCIGIWRWPHLVLLSHNTMS